MSPTDDPSAPPLPFSVFRVSHNVQRYMLYDIDTITWLRRTHNILGVLIGSLPQIPQQNVFLGLPLELQPEEARLLVDKGLGYVVDDLEWHSEDLRTKDAIKVERFKKDLHRQGMDIAKGLQQSKKQRSRKALERIRGKDPALDEKISNSSPMPENETNKSEETLFGDSQPQEPPSTSSNQPKDPDLTPWSITPTTSSSLSNPSPPKPPSPPLLPPVTPSSYALFAHLHSQNYFISPGLRFGCQFSVYPGDPLRFHSHFLATSYDWDEEIDLLDLVGGGRLGTGVKKGWLVGGLEDGGGNGEEGRGVGRVRTFCVEWGGM
ncbi:tRNA-splicing endonuclease subunit [Lecanora helva]